MSVEAPAGARRLPWLALLAVSTTVAVAIPATREAIRWRDPQQLQRVLKEQEETQQTYRPEADPRLGDEAPRLAMQTPRGERLAYPPRGVAQPAAVLFIGECTDCVAKTLAQWDRLRKKGYHIYVVTSSDLLPAQEFLGESGLGLPLLLERTQPHGAACYNAAFRPRAYVTDAEGKLIYVQADQETGTVALQKVTALLQQPPGTGNGADDRAKHLEERRPSVPSLLPGKSAGPVARLSG